MKQECKSGMTDYTVLVYIPDSASTAGSGKTGLVAANLTVSYARVETDNDVTITDATSSLNNLAALTSAHSDWGLLEVSNTLAPGLYRLDIADAVFASGAWSAVVYVMVTTSAAAASPMEFVLVPQSPVDGTHVAAIGAGGITAASFAANAITAAKLDPDVTTELQAGLATSAALTTVEGKIDTIDNNVDAILVDTAEIGAAGAGLTNINLPNQTMDIVGNITGNLSGSVGSVTGLTVAYIDAAISTRATQTSVDDLPTNAELSTALGTADDAVLTAIGDLPTNAELATALSSADDAVLSAIAALDIPTAVENADALLDRDMSMGADSGSTTIRTPRQALRFLRNKWSIAGSTLTVTKENDSTASWTAAVTGTSGADPITASDPAGP